MPPKKNITFSPESIDNDNKRKSLKAPPEYMRATYNKIYEREESEFLERVSIMKNEILTKYPEVESSEAQTFAFQIEKPRFIEKVGIMTKIVLRAGAKRPIKNPPKTESEVILKKTIDNILDREMKTFFIEVENRKRSILKEHPTMDESDAELKANAEQKIKVRAKVSEEARPFATTLGIVGILEINDF